MPRVPFDPATDYYQLLGISPGASTEEIQAAYRRLAKAFHPDLHADSDVAAARMASVNVAKSVLLDPYTRASYDQLRASRRQSVIGHGSPRRQSGPAPSSSSPPRAAGYVPYQPGTRPRHRVVSHGATRGGSRSGFDRQTGILFLVAVPLVLALAMYVLQAVQLSVTPLRAPPSDANLSVGPSSPRPTAHGAAEAVFAMIHAQPPSQQLAQRANNFILARSDSSPESELLRAAGRRLLRSADTNDAMTWDATVDDVCQLAGRC